MANRSYLTVTDQEAIYPSEREGFSTEKDVVAQGIYCVPLLWLAMFRPKDLRTQPLLVDGKPTPFTAPVVSSALAVAQLEAAPTTLDKMFAPQGTLADYVPLLAEAVRRCNRAYVTIELHEIECMDDPQSFQSHVRFALSAFDGQVPLPVGRKSLLFLTELNPATPFPPARYIVDGLQKAVTPDQEELHSRVLGVNWLQPVPWA